MRTTRWWPHLQQPNSQEAWEGLVLGRTTQNAVGTWQREGRENPTPWRRAGELANDKCSQPLGGLQGEVTCWSGKADSRLRNVGRLQDGEAEWGGLLRGWRKCVPTDQSSWNCSATAWNLRERGVHRHHRHRLGQGWSLERGGEPRHLAGATHSWLNKQLLTSSRTWAVALGLGSHCHLPKLGADDLGTFENMYAMFLFKKMF